MGADAKKQYVTVTGEGLTPWMEACYNSCWTRFPTGELCCCQRTIGITWLARSQQEQGDIPHWSLS
eukprot:5330434-Amphidinium_carterae.1